MNNMKEIDGDKLFSRLADVVNIAIILAMLFGVGFFIFERYQINKHETLKFVTETTYIKDGYSYSNKTSDCVMYDPSTTNDIDVIERYKKSHVVKEKKDGLKQEVKVMNDCLWLWMPKEKDIYR